LIAWSAPIALQNAALSSLPTVVIVREALGF